LSERDWETNVTILSGDINGDDQEDSPDFFKTDNARHVIWIDSDATGDTEINGLTIKNGYANNGSFDLSNYGGGIIVFGGAKISNCSFVQNYGVNGGGIYVDPTFTNDIEIDSCRFSNNRSELGGGLYVKSDAVIVSNSLFENNRAEDSGGAMVLESRSRSTILDCTFSRNEAEESGGAIYSYGSASEIKNSRFVQNRVFNQYGGAIFLSKPLNLLIVNFNIENSTFEFNRGDRGGDIACIRQRLNVKVSDSHFSNSGSWNVGGSFACFFGAKITFENSDFISCSGDRGGVGYIQSNGSRCELLTCRLDSNSANQGGALYISGSEDVNNTISLPQLTTRYCKFVGNMTRDYGGAIFAKNSKVAIFRSLIVGSTAGLFSDSGGTIYTETSAGISSQIEIIGSTIADNDINPVSGIVLKNESDLGSPELLLTNTILQNNRIRDNYGQIGSATVISGGGNHCSDNTMTFALTQPMDLSDADAGFADPGLDYRLLANSPCVNTGVILAGDTIDIDSNNIIGLPDKGAFENIMVGVSEFFQDELFGISIYLTQPQI